MGEWGIVMAHSTILRWIYQYGPELNVRIRPDLKQANYFWRVDETYIKVKGQ